MIKILFRDRFMVFCVKPEGILSQDSENAPNLPDVLREQLGTSYVGTVHRLDREASGVMVYSLDPKITGKYGKGIPRASHRCPGGQVRGASRPSVS